MPVVKTEDPVAVIKVGVQGPSGALDLSLVALGTDAPVSEGGRVRREDGVIYIPQGERGAAGPEGQASTVPGPKGDKGEPGAASTVPGPEGPQGLPGADSTVPGPAGPKGDKGDKGDRGDAGPAGADSTVPGPKGDKGDPGDTGPAGADSTVPGPKGDKGDPGAAAVVVSFATDAEAQAYSAANPSAVVFSREGA